MATIMITKFPECFATSAMPPRSTLVDPSWSRGRRHLAANLRPRAVEGSIIKLIVTRHRFAFSVHVCPEGRFAPVP